MKLTPNDLDALKRAIAWGKGYQKREPQIKVFPEPMLLEGTPEWIELAQHLAAKAQSHALDLYPWQVEPCYARDVVDSGWGGKPDEVALRQKMKSLKISLWEPDPPCAIAKAEHRRAA